MQRNNLFEYAVIRVVPRVEREEFVNVGIIVFCKKPEYLQTVFSINEERLLHLFPQIDIAEIREHLKAFERIAAADRSAGNIALLDAPSRFRWLTAKRSTIVQTSPVHPGLCEDMQKLIPRLLDQLVN